MKFALLFLSLALFAVSSLAQPKSPVKKTASKANSVKPGIAKKTSGAAAVKDEKTELEKALAIEDAERKANALSKFLADFPKSESRNLAVESLTASRIAAARAKFDAGERDAAFKLARTALEEAPVPYPDKLFAESISKLPSLMFAISGPTAAYESAAAIEKNAGSSAQQLLSLANFYLGMENGTEAKRLAEAALKLDEKSAAAYQTLGMANRLNFDLDAAAAAYEKAVELEPDSISSRQSLAEMKRATGKPEDAIAIFSALIEKDPDDLRSINGRILSQFDAGKRLDAETEFAKAIEAEPANFILLSGTAYWYAANGEPSKAIDLAGKAVAAEPRYIWAHIALARGLAGEGRFVDAEQVLLKAKKYGNFPTLDYEIAAMKFNAGFYREAAEELQKSFTVKDGAIVTKLGRRIERSEKSFVDLLSSERRASILEPKAADSLDAAAKMKALLEFVTLAGAKDTDESKVADAAAAFAEGSDKMRYHRQIFAAQQLADRSLAPAKVIEFTRSAVSSVEDGLGVPAAAAPIMASELYATRTSAIASDKYVLVPEVSRQTLSAIARGRIEELAGIALLQQKNNAEAAVRFRRAISILPEKSAWWRSSHWRLGTALEAERKDKEALDAYVKSYTSGEPDGERYAAIESVYKRVNSGTDGLETLIGVNPSKPAEKKVETEASAASDLRTGPIKVEKADASTEAKMDVTEVKAQPQPEKPTDTTTDAKPVNSPPPPVQEAAKPTESSSPQPEPKPTVVEKAAEIKPAEVNSEPAQNLPKLEETKSKPIDEPPPKSEEKKADVPNELKPVAADETQAKPAKAEEVKPEEKDPETKPAEKKGESHQPETKAEKPQASAKNLDEKPAPKLLFEPVVIEIKSSKPPKPSTEKSENSHAETRSDKSGASRARLVAGKDVSGEAGPGCAIDVSRENISLTSGKGSVGVLVGVANGDVKEVKGSSSSPKDVDVAVDPEAAGVSGKALFIIRSLTETTGTYQVSFAAPCGKKEVKVLVR